MTIIVVGFTTKRVPAIAAKIGLLSGSLLYIISEFYVRPNFIRKALGEAKSLGITDPERLKEIEVDAYPHFLHIMAILFALNVIIMLVIGRLKPRTENYIQTYTEQVEITPWPHAKKVGFLVICIVIFTFYYFKQ